MAYDNHLMPHPHMQVEMRVRVEWQNLTVFMLPLLWWLLSESGGVGTFSGFVVSASLGIGNGCFVIINRRVTVALCRFLCLPPIPRA